MMNSMIFDIITIFPKSFGSYFNESILKRAQAKKLVQIKIWNLRDFTKDKHHKVDDKPYGGGPGMVFKIEPIVLTIGSILKSEARITKSETLIILFSPAGKQFTQKTAREYAKKYNRIILIAGHYEGIDERVKKVFNVLGFKFQELSIGPYVLTGGELPAMVVIDAVARHIPGVLGKAESLEEKRYGVGVPVYTRPEAFKWRGKMYKAPKVLLSGNHRQIDVFRRKSSKV